MNPKRLPVAAELFTQWCRARSDRQEVLQRPFSRAWEKLLDDAGLLSALERNEAERDVRALAEAGWLEIKTVRYRTHLIERVTIPLAVESRWKEAFDFQPPSNEEARQIQDYPWVPELAFLRETRTGIPFDELKKLHAFLLTKDTQAPSIPIKERSFALFGDEKRLDALIGGALIRKDRLSLSALQCHPVIEPLGWQRGPTNTGSIIVLENAATWDSYRRWNAQTHQFSAVIYGQGNCFAERTEFLHEIFRELGSAQRVFYFGDLDAAGLKIPQRANQKAQQAGLPKIEPHLPSYRWLLDQAQHKTLAKEDDPAKHQDFNWLGELAEEAWHAIATTHRLAQEIIGWEFLSKKNKAD
ncbi:MAG TPA: Wadjet anti-phage system protein JetD domain-containing protein [Verrucomicrobiae bacterium]